MRKTCYEIARWTAQWTGTMREARESKALFWVATDADEFRRDLVEMFDDAQSMFAALKKYKSVLKYTNANPDTNADTKTNFIVEAYAAQIYDADVPENEDDVVINIPAAEEWDEFEFYKTGKMFRDY